ncbi:alpha/beta fold hydrolase [Aureimonas frigidaquae]|uniref:alpha/beta fold hydrolase n=1 Tax=Aureimonas frigidaquae TaxID=424757 RepID=UPI000781D9E8|nr:alpha/beta fold hydrolase [Aureimonas frigidaquae]
MSTLTLTMPRLGETMDEGEIVGWLVAPGEPFKRGQPILELETDKTVVEYPALGDGVIDTALAGPGDRVAVGQPIAKASVANPADWTDAAPPPAEAEDEAVADAPSAVSILRMPKLGETMEEGVIAGWLLAEGATYGRGDAILEVETDKTVAEVPALYEGRLLRILAQAGERLPVGAPIAEVEGQVDGAAQAPQPTVVAAAPAAAAKIEAPRQATSGAIRATPLARRLARRANLPLSNLEGTGRRGRIEARDVELAASNGVSAVAAGEGTRWIDSPAGRIAYSVAGTGGRVHLLVHGFAGERTAYAQLASAIARSGNTAVSLDLPGHGATQAEGGTIAALSQAVTDLAAAFAGPLTLVGHSLGAVACVEAAQGLRTRLQRLVLITPAGCGARIGADFVLGMAQAQSAGEVAHLLRLLGPKGGALSAAALDQMAAQLKAGRLLALAPLVTSQDGRQRVDILRALDTLSVTVPVSAIFGTQDRIVDAQDAMNLPFRVASHFLPTGHMPQWDAPRELADIVLTGAAHA